MALVKYNYKADIDIDNCSLPDEEYARLLSTYSVHDQ